MRRLISLLFVSVAVCASADVSTGHLIDERGRPLSGVTVHVVEPSLAADQVIRLIEGTEVPEIATVKTDDRGRFDVDVEPGRVLELRVAEHGKAPVNVAFLAGKAIAPIIVRDAPMRKGRVIADGQGVPGAKLLWSGSDGRESVAMFSTTDEQGWFAVPDPKRWSYSVVVVHPDKGSSRVLYPGWRKPGVIELEFEPGPLVSLRVEAQDGVPASSVEVSELPLPGTVTDGSGEGRLHVTASGVYVRAFKDGFVGMGEASGDTVRLKLREAASLRGTVTSEGVGVPGARVDAIAVGRGMRFEAIADGEGRYAIEGLPAGSYYAVASVPGVEFEGPDSPFPIAAGEATEMVFEGSPVASVSGVVVDEDDNPVSGAVVRGFPIEWLEHASSGSGRNAFLFRGGMAEMVYSDEDGRFTLEGEWERLIAIHDDYAATVTDKLQSEGEASGTSVTIRMERGEELSGIVVDVNGSPIAGAKIGVVEGRSGGLLKSYTSAADGEGPIWPLTDEGGRFSLRLNPIMHSLAFFKSGYQIEMKEPFQVEPGLRPITVSLRPGENLGGRVVWSNGDSSEGLTIMITADSQPDPIVLGSDGRFLFEGLEPGMVDLMVGKEDEGLFDRRAVRVPSDDLLVELDSGRDLSVVVTDEETGAPVSGVNGSLEPVGGMNEAPRYVNALEPSDVATLKLSHVKPGSYRLSLRAPGYTQKESDVFEVNRDFDSTIEMKLMKGRTITGVVRDESGEPLERVSIRSSWSGATSDVDGRFELEGVARAKTNIEFSLEGFVNEEMELEAGDGGRSVSIVMKRGLSVTGSVRDEQGIPVEDAMIWAMSADMESMSNANSDSDGEFELSGMGPGLHEVSVRARGYEAESVEDVDPSVRGRVDVVLKKVRMGSIAGLISGLDSDELARTWVMVQSGGSGALPDEGGRFRVEDVPAGETTVLARLDLDGVGRSTSATVEVMPDIETTVDLRFDPGFTISGRVTRGGRPAPAAVVRFDRDDKDLWATADPDGRYTVDAVAQGEYTVTVSAANSSFSKAVRIDSSRTLDIEMMGAMVQGRVTELSSGEPLSGAKIEIEPDSTELRHVSNQRSETDVRGGFRMEGLMDGDFVVRCEHEDYGQQIRRVRLTEGQSSTVNFALEKHEGIHVTVVDARTGSSLSGTVAVRNLENLVVYDGNPPRTGEGLQVPLGPGAYKLSASASGFATQTVRVAVPGPDVTLPLMPGGTIVVLSENAKVKRSMKLIMPDGEEYVQCWCNRISEFVIKDKRTEFENVAAGQYTMVVSYPDGGRETYPVAVMEGGTVEIIVR